ncbi:MAG: hypothetical protein JJU26_02640 [Oceanicaulis sp.]|nr:hypothetical protein [Oceanicaulis sp.]
MPWLAAFTLLVVPATASAQTQQDQAPIRALEVQLPPDEERTRLLAEREHRRQMLRAIEAYQAEREPERAARIQTAAEREREPMRFDMATFQRLAQRIGQRPEEEPEGAEADEAPEYDARGRRLSRIDWDTAATEWRRQLDQEEAEETEEAQVLTRAPRPIARMPRMTNREMRELERPRLPVLLPREEEAVRTRSLTREGGADGMMVYPHDSFYAATFHRRGVMVQITGSRIEAAHERDPEIGRRFLAMCDDEGYFVTRTDYGIEINFTRYGAAYAVLVACDTPDDDAECRDEQVARGVISRLALSGGTPQGLADDDPLRRRLP